MAHCRLADFPWRGPGGRAECGILATSGALRCRAAAWRPWRSVLALPLAALVALSGAHAEAPRFDALQWLQRVQQAAVTRNYQGTLVFTAGATASSSRVWHLFDGTQRYERIESLDGQARQQLRHNDVVLTLWPQSRVAVFEPFDGPADFPALPRGQQRVLDSYDARLTGQDRVAGVQTDVVLLHPRDALRFAQRLWSERQSGLLVRADVIGAHGEVLESLAFSDLDLATRSAPDGITEAMKRIDGYKVLRPQAAQVDLEAEGWQMGKPVPGFQPLSCTRRSLGTSAGAAGSADERRVLQAVYSDGLTHVSIFIEPFDARRHKPMRSAHGAMHTLMARNDQWWITIMGDVPMATIQQFEAGLKRR